MWCRICNEKTTRLGYVKHLICGIRQAKPLHSTRFRHKSYSNLGWFLTEMPPVLRDIILVYTIDTDVFLKLMDDPNFTTINPVEVSRCLLHDTFNLRHIKVVLYAQWSRFKICTYIRSYEQVNGAKTIYLLDKCISIRSTDPDYYTIVDNLTEGTFITYLYYVERDYQHEWTMRRLGRLLQNLTM